MFSPLQIAKTINRFNGLLINKHLANNQPARNILRGAPDQSILPRPEQAIRNQYPCTWTGDWLSCHSKHQLTTSSIISLTTIARTANRFYTF
jgi:hypothetical protein